MASIIFESLITWLLSTLIVTPITEIVLSCRIAQETKAADGSSGDKSSCGNRIALRYYILCHVLVLGTAGFIGGLLGFQCVGISLRIKGWPGVLAFTMAGYIGRSLGHG